MSKIVLITGSAGLIGSESVKYFAGLGFDVLGIDDNMRQFFFGEDASTEGQKNYLLSDYKKNYTHFDVDIRDKSSIEPIFEKYSSDISLIIHTAAQPSHDWAVNDPHTDFTVNANGTLTLLESTRKYCPQAVFIFCSTNKVYGDRPNFLPLQEEELRWEIDSNHIG
ncbi:NAD-dependent epimerase/dehydratase family protein [Geminocystis sp.]|uniref:NAD-dependent epimerase/dehydratase family protein n=1 Tax=Geminocystis sp. TaxID=2664100 RepID=UPI003594512C